MDREDLSNVERLFLIVQLIFDAWNFQHSGAFFIVSELLHGRCQDEAALRALTIEDEEDEEEGTTHSRPAPFTRYVPSHHARERELLSAGFRGGGHLHACSVLPARFPQARDNIA